MNSMLVPVEEAGSLAAQLETAIVAAKAFGAVIVGVSPRADFSNYLIGAGAGVGATIPVALEDLQREEEERVERSRAAFQQFMHQHKIAWDDADAPKKKQPRAAWVDNVGPGDAAIAQLARLYDITVLPRPTPSSPVTRRQLLETVLFESGRPVLLTPPDAPKSIGKRVLVAWNGSAESTRAVTFAMPFLAKAEHVVVLAVEGGMVEGPGAEEVGRMLARSGIAAEARTVRAERRSTGEAILAEAAEEKADLIIKGAYTQSRLKQMIFGGATSHIINEATLPVLMAH